MSCKVKQRALDVLTEEGAIENNAVVDFEIFDKLNAEFTQTAIDKYEVGTGNAMLFSVSLDTEELTVIPNDVMFDALQVAIDEYNKDRTKPAVIRDRLSDIEEITPQLMEKLYNNYAALMGRKEGREDKALDFKTFSALATNTNVYKYKDTYIFGNYDIANNVFITSVSSSPSSKELLAEALPNIVKNFDVIGSAPADVIGKYTRSGYVASTASFPYNFKGEQMDKYLYASNPDIIKRIFGKDIKELTSEEVENVTHRIMPLPEYLELLNHLARKKDKFDQNFVNEKLKNLKVPAHRRRYFLKTHNKSLQGSKEFFIKNRLEKMGYPVGAIKIVMDAQKAHVNTKLEMRAFQDSLHEIGMPADTVTDIVAQYKNISGKFGKGHMAEEIKKLYDYKKVQIDEKDGNLLGRKALETDTKLNKLLVNYLSHFGIKVEYLEDIQGKLGIDSYGTVDILNKIAYVDKNNTEELPQLAGHFIAYMLQHNPVMAPLLGSMKKIGRYKGLSNEELTQVAGELIAEQLHKKTNTKVPESLLEKLNTIIAYFFDLINQVKINRINKDIGFIVDNVLVGNQALIVASKYKPGDQKSKVKLVDLHEAIEGDEFAGEIVNEMAEEGFILTGSTVLAEQGTILRPEGNQMHDIDWVSTFGMDKTMEKVKKLYPNKFDVRLFDDKKNGVFTYTFLHTPRGTKLENVRTVGDNNVVTYYEVVDENTNELVGVYTNEKGVETHTGVQGKPIDIFINKPKTVTNYTTTKLATGTTLNIASWRNVFDAKLSYGRLKDIWDYNRYIPNEYITKGDIFESKIQDLESKDATEFMSYVPIDGDTEVEARDNTPVIEHILFDNNDGPFTAAEVLTNILANYPALNESAHFLLNKVIPVLGKTSATVRFVSEKELANGDTFMQYDASKNEIQIAKSRFENATPEYAVQGFLHEVVHSVTANAYLRPSTMEEKMFRDFIDAQYNKYVGKSLVEEYGLTSPMEFMAEAISNKSFQEKMIALDNSSTSFWSKLVDFIRTLFGVQKSPDFHTVVDAITRIADNVDPSFSGLQGESSIFQYQQKPNVPSLKTLQEKLDRVVETAIDNITQAAKRVKTSGKKGDAKRRAKDFRQHLNDLRDEMEVYAKAEQFQAIILYVESLRSTVYNLRARLDATNKDADSLIETITHFENYLSSYDMLDDINALLSEARVDNLSLSDEDIEDMKHVRHILASFAQEHKDLVSDMSTYKKKAITKRFATAANFPEVEYEWKNKLAKEYDPSNAEGLSKDEWITKEMLTTRFDEIQDDIQQKAMSLAEDIDEDITEAEARLSDPLNANGSKLFNLAVNIVAQMRTRIIETVRDFDFKIDKAYKNLTKGVSSTVPSKLYKNLLDTDKDGNYYLIGEYSPKFKQAYEQEYLALKEELAEYKEDSLADGYTLAETAASDAYREIIADMRAWEAEHTVRENGKMLPHPKYKNDLSKLTQAEKEFLDLFKYVNSENRKTFGKFGSLRENVMGVFYHRLPSVTKTNHERLIEKDAKGIVKENIQEMVSVRPDDVGFEEAALDGKNKPLKGVRIHYRGHVEPSQQSLDLANLLRLEVLNGTNFEEKTKTKIVLDEIAQIAKNKEFIATSERTGQWLVNKFRKNKNVATVSGKDSVTFKRLQSYIDTNIHDILNVHAGFSLAGADVNKLVKTVNGYTAVLGMAVNVASGTVNVLNGFSQLYIETFGGNHINIKSLQKAEKLYFKDMPNILNDLGNPVNKSITNQINQMFDTFGGFNIADQEFFKDSIAKRLASTKILSAMQDGGEHMMQSILTMAVLDGIKVMNADGRFINKQGVVVSSEKEAASMLDMMKIDENGIVYLHEEAMYTTHTRNVNFDEGGQAHISMFIKKKIHDTAGAYDSNLQPDIYRNWYGKLLLLFKRFLIPQMQNRWVGFSTIHKHKDELTESDLHFNASIKERMEGTHVTALRLLVGRPGRTLEVFFKEGVVPALKSLKLAHLPENWNNLNEYEKANVKKATVDLIATAVLLPLIGMLTTALADDEDEEYLWYLAYTVRRLESELSQFRNPREAWRITSNPVAGTRVIENALTVLGGILTPWDWFDVNSRGENKLINDGEKMIPVWVQFRKEWKQSYQFFENQAN